MRWLGVSLIAMVLALAPAGAQANRVRPAKSQVAKKTSVRAVAKRLRSLSPRKLDRSLSEKAARKLLRTQADAHHMAPKTLPPLLKPKDPELVAAFSKVVKGKSARADFVRLEKLAAEASASPERAELATKIRSYLTAYKQGRWSSAWLAARTTKFSESKGPGWTLNSRLTFESGTARQRKVMEKRLSTAWDILRGIVAPEILARVPAIEVIVTKRYPVAGILLNVDGTKALGLLPNSSVKDILHEYGHLIEDYATPKLFARIHGIRVTRSRGDRVGLSEVLPGTSYGPEVQAFPGGFTAAYMGRHYGSKGFTEVLSMGIERFHSKQSANKFFREDGDYVLQLLSALQH